MKRKPSKKVILEAIEQELLSEGPFMAGIKGAVAGAKGAVQNTAANYRLSNIGSQMDQFVKKAQKQWDTNVKQAQKQTNKLQKSSNPEIAQSGQVVRQQLDQADQTLDQALQQVKTGVARTMMGVGKGVQTQEPQNDSTIIPGSPAAIMLSTIGIRPENYDHMPPSAQAQALKILVQDPKTKKMLEDLMDKEEITKGIHDLKSAIKDPEEEMMAAMGGKNAPVSGQNAPKKPIPTGLSQFGIGQELPPEDKAADEISQKYAVGRGRVSAKVQGTENIPNLKPVAPNLPPQNAGQNVAPIPLGQQDYQQPAAPIPLKRLKPQAPTPSAKGFKQPQQRTVHGLDSEISQAASKAMQELPPPVPSAAQQVTPQAPQQMAQDPRVSDAAVFRALQSQKPKKKLSKAQTKKAKRAYVNKHGTPPSPEVDLTSYLPKKKRRSKSK